MNWIDLQSGAGTLEAEIGSARDDALFGGDRIVRLIDMLDFATRDLRKHLVSNESNWEAAA